MTSLLLAISTAAVAVAFAGCVYHLWWMAVALVAPPRHLAYASQPRTRFAVLIPAHNEENLLQSTLDSCRALDYPKDLLRVVVVADNCTDATAQVAAAAGVESLERFDAQRRGKGYALAWALPRLLDGTVDTVMVLDADCELDPHALRLLDAQLSQGHEAMQLNNVTNNASDSPISFLLAVANKLENDFFYAPKSRLGAAVLLRGTGMVLHADILRRFPWEAFSVVEDTDYSLRLLEAGVPIRFLPEARVVSAFPSQYKTLSVQRSRWVGGMVTFSVLRGLSLLAKGLFLLRPRLADAGITLLTLSRALIIGELVFAWLIVFAAAMVSPAYALSLAVALLVASLGYFAYAVVGLATVDHASLSWKHVVLLPLTTLTYLLVAMKSLLYAGSTQWVKTPRGEDV